jgi:hypothetical protein
VTTTVIGPLPPVVGFVRGLDGDFFLCREVAEALAVSTATLRRLSLVNPDAFAPSGSTGFGKMLVRLYTMGEVDRLHQHLEAESIAAASGSGRRPGRRRLWTEAERGTGVPGIARPPTGAVVVANSPMPEHTLLPQSRTGRRPASGTT